MAALSVEQKAVKTAVLWAVQTVETTAESSAARMDHLSAARSAAYWAVPSAH